MKCIFLLFLMLPNVLCFIIHGSRRPIYKGYISEVSKHNIKIITLTNGESCSEKFIPTIYREKRVEWDALTGLKTIQEVTCDEKKICDDGKGPATYSYFCRPLTDPLCRTASEGICIDQSKINIDCNCNYHNPKDFPWIKEIKKIL